MRRPHIFDAVGPILLVSWLGAASAEPIGSFHCNDTNGVSRAAGQTVTITGVVTGQFSTAKNAWVYVQDRTGGVCVYGSPKNCVALGDSVRVTGEVGSFGGLTQITGSKASPLRIVTLGRGSGHMVALALTASEVGETEQPDGCEPNESRLVLIPDMLVRTADGSLPAAGSRFTIDTNYRLAHAAADSATAWVIMRVTSTATCDATRALAGQVIPVVPVQVTGVLSQFAGRSRTRGGYQILPRGRGDVEPGLGDYRERVPNR